MIGQMKLLMHHAGFESKFCMLAQHSWLSYRFFRIKSIIDAAVM